MPVSPNITQTAGDNQHVESHHRYDCEWNQVLHTYLLNRFDNLVIFPAQRICLLLCKNCCAEKQLFFNAMHLYEVRPRKDHRGVDLISDALPFGRLWYGEPNAASNAIGYAMHSSRSHDAVIRVCGGAGNVIETHEHKGEL